MLMSRPSTPAFFCEGNGRSSDLIGCIDLYEEKAI